MLTRCADVLEGGMWKTIIGIVVGVCAYSTQAMAGKICDLVGERPAHSMISDDTQPASSGIRPKYVLPSNVFRTENGARGISRASSRSYNLEAAKWCSGY